MEDKEQAMYDTVALAARKAIMGDKEDDSRFRMVVNRLQGSENLAEDIGGIAGAVMGNVDGAARQKNREIPKNIIAAASDELVDTLIEVAEAAELTDGKDPALKPNALKAALGTLGKAQLSRMTPEEKARVAAEYQKGRQPQEESGILASRRAG